jgi:hypothetical protein
VIRWGDDKDRWLREQRGVSFREIADRILSDGLIDMVENPSRHGQEAFVIRFRTYTWVVPFVVEDDDTIFLKTAYPSRKMHRRYGGIHEAKDQPG